MPTLRLRGLNGPRRGEELTFAGPRVRIGRSRDNDLLLTDSDDPKSSGHHAEALVERGAWQIVDCGSRNGTYVNGVRVERRALAPGDVLAFGDDQFVVAGRAGLARFVAAAVVLGAIVAAGVVYSSRRPVAMTLEDMAATAARAAYAVVIEDAGRASVLGTAFAVRADGRLITNAHLAEVVRARGGFAVRSDTFERRRIASVTLHPKWKHGELPFDAAVLQLEPGPPLEPLPVDEEGIATLQRGTRVTSFGFPAASTTAERPRGRLVEDVIGDVRGDFIEAGLAISPGTSGSPVFDRSGRVVAIVAGGDFMPDARGGLAPTGSAANWAIRATVVRDLLRP